MSYTPSQRPLFSYSSSSFQWELRGRDSKQITDGSKTAVMDVIGCICVSLGSSTVQVADIHAHVHRLVSVFKMATVLERSVVLFFFGQKDSMQRIVIRKCFLFTAGSVFRVKRFTTGSRNSLKDVRKSQMLPDQAQKWLRQQLKGMFYVLYPFVSSLLTLPRK
jgi:hypothetical protein